MIERAEVVLDAIRANAGLEVWYRRALQSAIREMAKSVLLHVRAAYQQADKKLSVGFAQDGPADASSTLRRALRKWGRRSAGKFDDKAQEMAKRFARRARTDIDRRFGNALKKAGFSIDFKATAAMKEAYQATIAEQVNLIKSIPAQFLKDVQSQVWLSVMKGADMGALTRSIQGSYGVAHRRAAFIARDQTNKARAIMEEARRSELGIEQAVWVHSGGGKEPRPTHLSMAGKRYQIKQGMWDSAINKYVWPGTEPNCRCVSRSVIPGL